MKEKEKKKSSFWLKILILAMVLFIVAAIWGMIFLFRYLYSVIKLNMPRTDIPAEISVIKDASAQIDFAKQEGDVGKYSSAQNDAVYGRWSVSASFDGSIISYARSISSWGESIQNSANKKDWGNIGSKPQTFTLDLTAQDASDSYDDALSNIDNLKTFGDYAIAKNDKTTMRWISARLYAEEIFLSALSNDNISSNNVNTAFAATTYGTTCYWGRGRVMVYSNRTHKGDCLKQLTNGIKPARDAAKKFAKTGKADDAKAWDVAWDGVKNLGYPLTTTGASVNQNGQPIIPPTMQVFRDDCKAKGGKTPAGSVKDRLPTTESGMTCTYKGPQGGFCWNFQTDSGKEYSGGDADCPQKGLLPAGIFRNTPPAQNQNNNQNNNNSTTTPSKKRNTTTPKTVPKTVNYDGIYNGNSSVAYGLTGIRVLVSGGRIRGEGIYVGDYNAQIHVTISGALTGQNGEVIGIFSGSGTVQGNEVTCSGKFGGRISGNSMNVTYSATGAGQSYSGSLVLTRE